nr:hypothetical protein [Halomonas sp. 54_146]
MRHFYRAFPIRETLSLELSWSHYNLLAKVDNPQCAIVVSTRDGTAQSSGFYVS